jgi:hypothetical protein
VALACQAGPHIKTRKKGLAEAQVAAAMGHIFVYLLWTRSALLTKRQRAYFAEPADNSHHPEKKSGGEISPTYSNRSNRHQDLNSGGELSIQWTYHYTTLVESIPLATSNMF